MLSELSADDQILLKTNLKIFHTATNDTLKIQAISNICEELVSEKWINYQYFLSSLIEKSLFKKHDEPTTHFLQNALASNYNNLGLIAEENSEIDIALEYYEKASEMTRKIGNEVGLSEIYNNVAHIYKSRGDIPSALNLYEKSVKIKIKNRDKKGLALTYFNLGSIYEDQKNFKTALNYYFKSLKIRMDVIDKKGIADCYNNIASVYSTQNKKDLALLYHNKSLKMRLEIGDMMGIAGSYNNIGVVLEKNGNTDLAIEHCMKALNIYLNLNNKNSLSSTYKNIGELKLKQNKIREAKFYAEKGMALSLELGYPESIKRNARLLGLIARSEKDYKTALKMKDLEIEMKNKLESDEATRATAELQAKHEYEKKQAIKDKEHEKVMAIQKEKEVQQTLISYFAGGGLILVGGFLYFAVSRLKLTHRQKKLIEEAHGQLEIKNHEILDSIQYAKRIQSAILPPIKLIQEKLPDSFVFYQPKDIVAGDFYWFNTIRKSNVETLLIAAADCTGHGVPGAMVSVICNNGLNKSIREQHASEPGDILNQTRKNIIAEFEKSEEDVKDGMDISLCSIQYNIHSKNEILIQFAGANNPIWICRQSSQQIEEIKGNKQPIGKHFNQTSFTTHSFNLEQGDCIYLFTDGFVDQFGGKKGKKFKSSNLKELLIANKEKPMKEQVAHLKLAFNNWKGDLEQVDDICVIGIRL